MAQTEKGFRKDFDGPDGSKASVNPQTGRAKPIAVHDDPRGRQSVDPHFGNDAVLSDQDSRNNRKAQREADRERRARLRR